MSFIGQRADIQIISYLGEETVDILLHMTSFSVESFFSEIFLDLFSKLLNFIKTFLIPMIIWKIEKEGLQDFFYLTMNIVLDIPITFSLQRFTKKYKLYFCLRLVLLSRYSIVAIR